MMIKYFLHLGQAFYAGGSERSGQQIIGPPKNRNNDRQVEKIFESARKQGATKAQDDDSASSSPHRKDAKPFSGAGYSLSNTHLIQEKSIQCSFSIFIDNTNPPPQTHGQPPPRGAAAAAPNAVEQLPLRLYSNGFTVGDGELRKYEENKEFMEYIKRGEVPPELRNIAANGQQIQVNNHNSSSHGKYSILGTT